MDKLKTLNALNIKISLFDKLNEFKKILIYKNEEFKYYNNTKTFNIYSNDIRSIYIYESLITVNGYFIFKLDKKSKKRKYKKENILKITPITNTKIVYKNYEYIFRNISKKKHVYISKETKQLIFKKNNLYYIVKYKIGCNKKNKDAIPQNGYTNNTLKIIDIYPTILLPGIVAKIFIAHPVGFTLPKLSEFTIKLIKNNKIVHIIKNSYYFKHIKSLNYSIDIKNHFNTVYDENININPVSLELLFEIPYDIKIRENDEFILKLYFKHYILNFNKNIKLYSINSITGIKRKRIINGDDYVKFENVNKKRKLNKKKKIF